MNFKSLGETLDNSLKTAEYAAKTVVSGIKASNIFGGIETSLNEMFKDIKKSDVQEDVAHYVSTTQYKTDVMLIAHVLSNDKGEVGNAARRILENCK